MGVRSSAHVPAAIFALGTRPGAQRVDPQSAVEAIYPRHGQP
jgi:hypothetical protein